MINLAIIASLVIPVVLVLVVDRATVRLKTRRRRHALAVAVAAEQQTRRPAAMPATQTPRVAGPDHATADARSVA
jgi:hypothetical protein